MGQTIAEKIFSKSTGKVVKAGDFVEAAIDIAMIHDVTGPLAVKTLYHIADRVWDRTKVVMLFDHQVPADSIEAAVNHLELRKFAKREGILNYDVQEGICHQVMVEKGHALPGELIIGADSHTCTYGAVGALATGVGSTDMGVALATGRLWFKVPDTIAFEINGKLGRRVYTKDLILAIIGDVGANGATYKSCEFGGETIKHMEIANRMTLCNMAIEMGGKAGIVAPDEMTATFLHERAFGGDFTLHSDEDATKTVRRYAAAEIVPMVAKPHRVDNVVPVTDVEGQHLDQVFIGSCTNGRYEDLQAAAEILEGETIARGVRMIVIPASRTEYQKALKTGLIDVFTDSGALVEAPCCGPCMGGSFGMLGPEEVGLSTSNRNFVGRQGSPQASIYLCSPATAAASAIDGIISDPRTH
ncbi:MAG TPA: 3-isopropylmalate dehydratase large subunit [Candidatus Acidoferrales bacterium]|nr:3-isopropylmalate dehydratase large subunit [Candidatus Acidoferrales bacterium]